MTTTDKPLDLDAILGRCDAATAGPWRSTWDDERDTAADDAGEDQTVVSLAPGLDYIPRGIVQVLYYDGYHAGCTRENAGFIAAARDDVPALVAEVQRLRASNERLRNTVDLDAAIYDSLARAVGFTHEPPATAQECVAAVHAQAAEVQRLREIVAGRETAPTDAEIAALEAAGGRWLYMTGGENGLSYSRANTRAWRDYTAETGHTCRWWALDASGAPTQWPVVTP